MNQIVDRYKDKHKSHTSKENSTAANVAHENFNKLAQAHYIERCPASEPYLESEKEDDTAGKKKTAKSKVKTISTTIIT